jgi:LPS-assembly protein
MRGGVIAIGLAALAAVVTLAMPRALAAGEARTTREAPVLFNADEVQYDQELGLTVATGHVELDQGDDILLADAVTYNQRSDTVTASGHIALLQPTGDIVFADFAELHDQMRDGFIKDIRILLSDRSRLAGNTARRVAGVRTTIRRAVYSPCELCQDDPTRPPVWQIKAEEVVHDKDLQLVEYHDATMEIDGIPVFYAPYFSHPDPSVKRASGFLPPIAGYGNTLGFHTSLPYYWDIAPDKDATIRPMITTSAGVVLGGEYRERFSNGYMVNDGSVEAGGGSESANAGGVGPETGQVRWDYFGTGDWALTDESRAGYQIQRESDQTYMLRYHFPTPYNYLTSHLYNEYFGPNSYGSITADAYQSLSEFYGDSLEPIALPDAQYTWTSQPDLVGGRWNLTGSALDLIHHTGPEVRRVSTGAAWELPFDGLVGDRFTFLASLRTDGYSADHVALTPSTQPVTTEFGETLQLPTNVNTVNTLAGRAFPQISLKWRYPWVRESDSSNILIEPITAVVAAPRGGNPARIPDEDSQGFEFDESDLFVPNRLPGYDRVDSGQRVDYGIHGEVNSATGQSFETLIGQSYAFETNDIFAQGSGLDTRLSDYVGRFVLSPNQFLNVFYRFRLNKDDLAARSQEAGTSFGPDSLRISASFIAIQPNVSTIATTPTTSAQVSGSITAQLTRYWSLALVDTRSIGGDGSTINSGVTATYHDDCFAVVTSVTQSGIRVGDVRPGVSVLLTLVFKNLGEVGERVLSESGT